jgi:hypothetical protein
MFVSKILIIRSFAYVGCVIEDVNILCIILLILQNPTRLIGYKNISEKVTLELDDVLQILDLSEVSDFSQVFEFWDFWKFLGNSYTLKILTTSQTMARIAMVRFFINHGLKFYR